MCRLASKGQNARESCQLVFLPCRDTNGWSALLEKQNLEAKSSGFNAHICEISSA